MNGLTIQQRPLETARLRIRPFTPGDALAANRMDQDADAKRYTGGVLTIEQTRAGLERIIWYASTNGRGLGTFALVCKSDERYVGWASLKPLSTAPAEHIEVGYGLDRAVWGRGLATEAGRALLGYGFNTLGLDEIVAVVNPANAASLRVVEKLGLRYQKQVAWPEQGMIHFFALSRPEYKEAAAAAAGARVLEATDAAR